MDSLFLRSHFGRAPGGDFHHRGVLREERGRGARTRAAEGEENVDLMAKIDEAVKNAEDKASARARELQQATAQQAVAQEEKGETKRKRPPEAGRGGEIGACNLQKNTCSAAAHQSPSPRPSATTPDFSDDEAIGDWVYETWCRTKMLK